jgi:16S rRNA (uracil1498-N3)-methyltransferase
VVIAACEQCGRNRIPEVHALIALSNYRPSGTAMRILLSPLAQQPLSELSLRGSEFVVAAGPEAGFTSEEEAALVSSGFAPALLGPRVLRTETAAVAALAALSALRGDS